MGHAPFPLTGANCFGGGAATVPGGCNCTDTSPVWTSRVMSCAVTAATADSHVNPSLTRLAMVAGLDLFDFGGVAGVFP